MPETGPIENMRHLRLLASARADLWLSIGSGGLVLGLVGGFRVRSGWVQGGCGVAELLWLWLGSGLV